MIRLKKLEPSDLPQLTGRPLYCYEKSEAYLAEFQAAYPTLAESIAGILDENRRSQGMLLWEGREIPVRDPSFLLQADLKEYTLLIMSDYHEEAFERLCCMLPESGGEETVYCYVSRETETELEYRERYRDTPLENMILFRSGPHASSYVKGTDFSDNARALFEYMLEERFHETWELVWLVKDPEEFSSYQGIRNVSFLSFDWCRSEKTEERERYYRALCLARYLFFTDAYGFARNCRRDQIRVQLWHGCGFKTRVNFVRCEKRYEYTTVISDLYAKIHQDIYGLRPDQTLVTGYAKEDWLFHPKEGALRELGLPEADRYIFWLPTFRMARESLSGLNENGPEGQTGLPVMDTYEKVHMLEELLAGLNTVLVIKPHPFQDRKQTGQTGTEHIRIVEHELTVEKDIQINRVLGYADGLISDYSSAAVDYMLLDRPMGFTLDDVEEYERSRGFVFDNIRQWLPGRELFCFEQLCTFIKDTAQGRDPDREKRRRLLGEMHSYRDDQSCRRIVEALGIRK